MDEYFLLGFVGGTFFGMFFSFGMFFIAHKISAKKENNVIRN